MIKKLTDLKQGQKAVIKDFETDDLKIKLMEMGCMPGENIMLEQIAPLGDPISFLIQGYTLSLRRNEADQILVIVE